MSGLACDVGVEGGGGAGREWVAWERQDVWADPVVVQVRDDGGRWVGGGTLWVMWYGPNPEMGLDGRPVQAVVQAVPVGGGSRVASLGLTGWTAPTHGPRVFRACMRVGGVVHDTGPVHVVVGRWTSLVELTLP